jgi:type VI secretion system protein ImpK
MNLKEMCHPLFQYVCSLYLHHENGKVFSEEQVRSEVRHCFESMHESVIGNTILADQLSKIELPLIFFVDYMIKEGPFEFSKNWVELARDFNELSGDEKFFDILDETLSDPSPSATERISIFYTCIALGFYGCYSSDPKYLERKIKICALRINLNSEASQSQPFGKNVYETVLKENRFKDPRKVTRAILVAVILIFISVVVANMIYFNNALNKTRERFHNIEDKVLDEHRPKRPEFLKIEQNMRDAEEQQKKSDNQKSSTGQQDQSNQKRYPTDQIEQASWFSAYRAGSQLDENYDPEKDNQKNKDNKNLNRKTVPAPEEK